MKKEDADQLVRCMKECWWRVAAILLMPSLAVLSITVEWETKSSITDWFSAIGTIGAVVATVILYVKSIKDKKKKSKINFVSFITLNRNKWSSSEIKIKGALSALKHLQSGTSGPPLSLVAGVFSSLKTSNEDLKTALDVEEVKGMVFARVNVLAEELEGLFSVLEAIWNSKKDLELMSHAEGLLEKLQKEMSGDVGDIVKAYGL